MNKTEKIACSFVCLATMMAATAAQAGVWLRFTFTKVRSVAQIQMSELAVYDKFGSRVNLNLTEAASGTAAEDLVEREFFVSHPGQVNNYETYLFDGKTTTKYYYSTVPSVSDPKIVTMRLDDGTNIAGYNICTGDDQSGRDPVSWTVELSSNGVDWSVLDTQSDFVPTTTRKTWYDGKGGTSGNGTEADYFRSPYPVTGDYFKVEPVPDQFRLVGAITPEPVVKDPDTDATLVKDVDYTLSYTNNDIQGTGTITITGKAGSAYEGKVGSVDFRIYQYVKSITSTGTQYINTGIVPGPTTAVEMYFNTTNCANNTAFFGSGSYKLSNNYAFSAYDGFYCFYGAATSMGIQHEQGIDGFISISTNAADNCYFNLDGNAVTKTVSLTYTGTTPLGLFSTAAGESRSKITLYSFKIWQGGALVRDFVPVHRGRIACLLDRVTTNLFENAGTGYFLYGPDETDVTVARIPNQFYSGTALEPAVVVSNLAGTALLVKDVDYTVAYTNNAAAGTGKAIVTGIGAYSSVVTNTFAIYTAPAAPAMPVTAYIQHGLMNHWDAIDNAGTGTFDPTARTWKDLKGSLDFTLNGNAEWGDGFLETHGYSGTAPGKTGQYLTIEIKYHNTKPRRGMPFASGYSNFRVVWNRNADQLWFHHQNNEYRYTLTGLNSVGTTYDFSVVYGTPNGGADQPAYFYDSGVRKTSDISNQKLQNANMGFIPSFPTAVIGSGSENQCNYEGRIYSIRLYDCPLSAREVAYNAAVDKVRYDGVAPAEAFNAPDMRWNATSGKVEVLITVGLVKGGGTFSINGGGASEWVSVGDAVEIVYTPAEGEKALEWFDLPDGATRSSDYFTVNFTAEAPVAAKLQLLKQIDVTRALNADPGIEEGSGSFNDGANRSFMPVSWNRTADRAWTELHGTSSDERGWVYLRPYQGNTFFQEGLALPAGTYTLTFDHAAVTDGLAYYWRLYDATNGVHSICNVTNDVHVYGTSWHTVQTDFTIAEGGIYKLQTGMAAGGGNCYISFDNVSITSDTDLHIEVEKCYPYFGEAQVRPPVVVRDDDGNILTEGVDYELLYGANNSPGFKLDSSVSLRHGNGYVAAKGLGSHYGVAGANFRIGMPIYVKPDGLPTNGGTSWADAVDFATALTLAAATNINHEIWIAGSNVLASAATSKLLYGNKIFRGGFKGTESTIEEREDGAYSTIDGDGQFSAMSFRIQCNIFFERLHFRGSPSRAVSKTIGGGDVFIDDCAFEDNGNALYVQGVNKTTYSKGSLYVKNSVFQNNSSTDDANGSAAIYSYQTRRVSVENSLFAGNTLATSSRVKTSAIFANTSALELKECDFVGNIGSGSTYGTVRASGSDAKDVIRNCLFLGNQAGGANAAQVTIAHSNVKTPSEVVNCTFAANENATAGGCAGVKMTKGKMSIRNSIFHGNSGYDFVDNASCPYDVDSTMLQDDTGATYSFVNGQSKIGGSMIYGDPLFAAADDCHLLSEAGYFDSEGVIHYAAEDVRSPAIDAGDPESDFSRESAPNGGCVNLGRYGNTEQASRTPSAMPAVGTPSVSWNDPDGYSMPTVSFTMGGSGSYTAHGVVYVSTDGGSTWEDVSGVLGGLVKGDTKEFRVPGYYVPSDTIKVKVAVEGAGQSSESEVASVVVAGMLPPWYGKKGPDNVIHVRQGALGRNDGTSWTDAFAAWPDALDALSEDKNEIWYAGTNVMTDTLPTKSIAYSTAIRGGFRGWEESAAERQEGLRTYFTGNNAYPTMTVSVPAGVVLTVDRIHFAHSSTSELRKSGAGDLVVSDCLFTDSRTDEPTLYGRGVYATGGTVSITNCQFRNLIGPNVLNSPSYGGTGLYLGSCTMAYVDDCLFVTNGTAFNYNRAAQARHRGGAFFADSAPTIIRNCRFAACSAAMHEAGNTGGIVYFAGASGGSKMVNCVVTGNSDLEGSMASQDPTSGGAVVCNMATTNDTLEIENCTIAYNLTQGKWTGAGITVCKGKVNLKNSIVYGNYRNRQSDTINAGADIEVKADGTLNMSYTFVTGLTSNYVNAVSGGVTNIGAGVVCGDPLLVSSMDEFTGLFTDSSGLKYLAQSSRDACAAFDVHLLSAAGSWINGKLEKRPHRHSPAIDAGDPKSDYSREPVVPGFGGNGHRVNLGAFGNTPEAALSFFRGSVFIVR